MYKVILGWCEVSSYIHSYAQLCPKFKSLWNEDCNKGSIPLDSTSSSMYSAVLGLRNDGAACKLPVSARAAPQHSVKMKALRPLELSEFRFIEPVSKTDCSQHPPMSIRHIVSWGTWRMETLVEQACFYTWLNLSGFHEASTKPRSSNIMESYNQSVIQQSAISLASAF